ncbi:AAA family ATPase [bacterium]|nr:AAA family ATPase [bacterium]
MICTNCGKACREGARFCGDCGAALVARCPSCGAERAAGARFCDACGAPLTAAEAGARKVVTIVFADLAGSTALHERLDAESARRLMERYYAALRGAVEAHGGTVVKLLGDGVMAAFGIRRVAEDDALRAVRAGVAMQDAFRLLVRDQAGLGAVGLRVAVNSGEMVVGGADDDLIGDPVNVAARLQEQGRDGDVVVGEATHRLVAARITLAPLGSVPLKGRAGSVAAYRVVSLAPPAGATAAPFVGRADELARLDAVYADAVAAPATRLAVLLGSPGLGKSRLMDELGRRRGEAAIRLAAHCDAAGGATFAPLVAALRAHLGIADGATVVAVRAAVEGALAGDDGERARIAGGVAALLAGAPPPPQETFFVVRRFLAGLAAASPVMLLIDDLHWAEPLLLDLVEHLVQWGGGVPLFVLVGARPELRELRSTLAAPGALVAEVVILAGLDAGAATRLAANVIGAADLPAAVAAKVLATSEGNPLFVGELVRMLVQEGALAREGERWIVGAGLAALEMPPTIHALLAARIERLRPEERQVLERAAVVGRHFSRGAVAALLQIGAADLDARLESLRRSELIERDASWLLGEPALRFHHVLIRDAAYRRLLKGTRAALHARLADWIEAQVGDAAEHDETIGWHLEQAHQLLAELGPLDAAATALGGRAATRLAAAGRRALAGDDVALAAALLGRALARLDAGDPGRADLLLDWCEALLSAGDVGPAAQAIAELQRLVASAPGPGAEPAGAADDAIPLRPRAANSRLAAWHTCFAGQLTVLTAPQALQATAAAVAAAAATLAAVDDAAGEAKAHSVHAQALARLGQVGACEAALDTALAAARRAGDRRRANAVLAGAPLAALWGPSPVPRASGRCLDVVRVLRITQGAPAVEAVALSCQGVLEALRGRTAAARRMLAGARQMVEDLGIAHRLHECDVFAGRVDLLEGDAAGAERRLRSAYDGLRALGLGIDAARAGALLARALLAGDRAAEAEALAHESEALAGDDLQAAIAWHGARAEVLARRGEHAAAIELARAAVAIAAATDALLDHADARRVLAAALRAAGRPADAAAEERRAIALWETKGATLLAERARPREWEGGAVAADATVAPRRAPAGVAPMRRVRANRATAMMARTEAAFAARDLDAVDALLGEAMESVDHPTEAAYGRQGQLESSRRMMRIPGLSFRVEPLATLGDDLALLRRRVSASGAAGGAFDVGAYEMEHVGVVEVDAAGRCGVFETYAPDRLGDAVARLYERYAALLPEGRERDRAAAVARSLALMTGPLERGRIASALAADVELADHRLLGTWSARGLPAALRHVDAWLAVGEAHHGREVDVLASHPAALLLRRLFTGLDRESGGAFEGECLVLWRCGDDGRITHWELFDVDGEDEAFARFDALLDRRDGSTDAGERPSPRSSPADPFANAATRFNERFVRAWRAGDWQAILALHPPPHCADDRRRLMQMQLPADSSMAQLRFLFDVPGSRFAIRPLATRGERLALSHIVYEGEVGGSGGALAIEYLGLDEVDAEGRSAFVVLFDPDAVDAAHAELDRRYDAGEGAVHGGVVTRFIQGVAARDWAGVAALCAPTLVEHDHRRLTGLGTTRGADQWVENNVRVWLDLAPDIVARQTHVRGCARGILAEIALAGSREGGAFALAFVAVIELDAQWRFTRIDVYDVDQLALARARFAELQAAAAAPE